MSKDIGIFFKINFNILLILFHSCFSFTGFDPGLVDSPPTSIMDEPLLYKLIARVMPLFFLLNFPPSEKLSGVRFNTPKIFGIFLKLKLEKFFFLNLFF